ncbi:MAG: CoA-binding protein, partial [Gammaproteobacteria bacterium]|nr:CoA-binding protein [Gammaproteobacteria bacterium]
MSHRLDPLLRPRSVAIVGASARPSTIGNHVMQNVIGGRYPGAVFPVNPGYEELLGLRCYPEIAALPEVPELAIFCVSDERIEAALDTAIAAGVPAVSIMSTLYLDNDRRPFLNERVRSKITASGVIACGANGMGFYNVTDRLWACGFDSRKHEPPGNIAFISHSGSGMCGIVDCDRRLRFNLAVSTGNELGVTMDEYLDFALDLPDTRVVGLFIETARNPAGLRAALQKANDSRIPVIAIKVGKTAKAAEMAMSHSGAIAGDDAAYDALFDRYGVQRVADMEEMAMALILFAAMHPIGSGGLVALHDSGGERQLLIDLADKAGVPLTPVSEETARK